MGEPVPTVQTSGREPVLNGTICSSWRFHRKPCISSTRTPPAIELAAGDEGLPHTGHMPSLAKPGTRMRPRVFSSCGARLWSRCLQQRFALDQRLGTTDLCFANSPQTPMLLPLTGAGQQPTWKAIDKSKDPKGCSGHMDEQRTDVTTDSQHGRATETALLAVNVLGNIAT